jgi:hypothetical protein
MDWPTAVGFSIFSHGMWTLNITEVVIANTYHKKKQAKFVSKPTMKNCPRKHGCKL